MKATADSPNAAFFRRHEVERIVMRNPSGTRSARMIREPESAPPMHLTPRQLEVLALLCEGLPNKLIARRLNIAGATVKAHIGSILRELGVSSRVQAVIAAPRLGLVSEPMVDTSSQPRDSAPTGQSILARMFLDEGLCA